MILFVHSAWLNSVWFLSNLDAPVKVRLAMAMQPKVLAPGEVAPNRHLYVMVRGTAMFARRVLTRGMAWGDDVVLTDPKYFLPFLARAVTYADVTYVTRDTLYEIVEPYPSSRHKLRRATILLAMRRSIILIAQQQKKVEGVGLTPAHQPFTLLTISGPHSPPLGRTHHARTPPRDVRKRRNGCWSGGPPRISTRLPALIPPSPRRQR